MSHTTSSGQTWDDRYSEEGFAFGEDPNDFLVEVEPTLAKGDTLMLGDGDGRNGVWVAQQGHRVVSVDLSAVGASKAKQLAAQRGTTINAHVGDLDTFALGAEAWDNIVSIFCHVPSDVRRRLHDKVKVALRPGGRFVLESYNAANIGRGVGGPQSTDLTVELDEIEADFAGWTLEVHRAIDRNIVEGKYHDGHSSTVQFVAVKPDESRNS
ncbi:MAG: class I SAM-dependent methyltransferase [Actinobacteria bacterium]|nr:class I SAM-dependent methyltransferase [Actinomycetota bacterium]